MEHWGRVRYDVTPDIALDLSYRYLDLVNPPCLTRMQKRININQKLR